MITTVFSVNGVDLEVEGCGQATVSAILKQYPLVKKDKINIVVLRGFVINGEFHEPRINF